MKTRKTQHEFMQWIAQACNITTGKCNHNFTYKFLKISIESRSDYYPIYVRTCKACNHQDYYSGCWKKLESENIKLVPIR